jgi:hypothetical protein
MQRTIRQMVAKGSHVMTDELNVYHATGMSYQHDMIRHSSNVYAMGNVHTNTVEGFFSLLKRGINGTFHHVSKGHLARYCDEFEFRWNNRKITDGERAELLVQGAEGKRLTYEQPEGSGADRSDSLQE